MACKIPETKVAVQGRNGRMYRLLQVVVGIWVIPRQINRFLANVRFNLEKKRAIFNVFHNRIFYSATCAHIQNSELALTVMDDHVRFSWHSL